MIDFVKSVCTPAKVYFLLSILIGMFSLFSGKFLNHVMKDKSMKKSKKILINRFLYFSFIFALIFITLMTLLFNYFCSLGYVNIVGGVVGLLILWRFYMLFYKGY